MGVPLSGTQRSVAEHLLHFSQIGAAVEHMGRGAVPQGMRADIRHPRIPSLPMHNPPDDPLIDSSATASQEQRFTGLFRREHRTADTQPLVHSTRCRSAERNNPLLIPFTGDPDGPLSEIDIDDIDADKFPDADARGIQQLHHRSIAYGERPINR